MSRSRSWCFTLNYPDELLGEDTFPGATYVVYQEEMENTYHFQGYVYWPTVKSLTQMQAYLPRAHWEIARGTPAQVTFPTSRNFLGNFLKRNFRIPATVPSKSLGSEGLMCLA